MKKALVIGSSGQDGSLICKSLLKKGFEVYGTTRSGKNKINNHLKLEISDNIHLEKLNICDSKAIEKLIEKIDPSEIYQLAAESSVAKSFKNPELSFNSICNSSIAFLEASKRLKFDGKLFFAGSSEIFGNTHSKACINDIFKPLSPYAMAKIASFQMVEMYRKLYSLKVVTGILFNHESDLRPDQFIIKKIIKGAILSKKNKNYKLQVGNIKIERDWGLAEEFVEAMQIQLRSDKNCDQIICTGVKTSLEDFIRKTFNFLELNWKDHISVDKKFFRPQDIQSSVGDPSKMREDTGWFAKYKINQVVENLLEKELVKSNLKQ